MDPPDVAAYPRGCPDDACVGCYFHRAQITEKEQENLPGVLIDVAKHVSSLKYHIWEKMADLVQYSKQHPPTLSVVLNVAECS